MANRDLTPWRGQGPAPFGRDPFASFRREMDRLFDDFFAPAEARSFGPPAQGAAALWPTIDVEETEQAYTVTAELPGIEQKDLELNLHDNALTLRGEKRAERNEDQGGRRYSERSFGRFERTIPFETEVDAERVEASCENGVLKVTLPKNAQARDKSRRIEIRPNGGSQAGGETLSQMASSPQSGSHSGSLGGSQNGSPIGRSTGSSGGAGGRPPGQKI